MAKLCLFQLHHTYSEDALLCMDFSNNCENSEEYTNGVKI